MEECGGVKRLTKASKTLLLASGDADRARGLLGGQAGGPAEIGGAADTGRIPRPHHHAHRRAAGQGLRRRGNFIDRLVQFLNSVEFLSATNSVLS